MCGLAGKYHFASTMNIDRDEIQKMGDILAHRGPDGQGSYYDENCGLIHRRLSIIDLEGGSQPIFNEDKTKLIVFNGEIYNYRELRKTLEKQGHRFTTNSDTETILHLYEQVGNRCVEYLSGMFSFAIWDTKSQNLLLARDRLGIKPLYFGIFNGTIIFASEMKAILLNKEVRKEIDFQALSDYLSFLYVPAPNTIFKNIFKLPAGHILRCSRNGYQIEKFWDPPVEMGKQPLTEEEVCNQSLDLIKDAVKIRLMSEVPLGAFLSGGIDSSLVSALMQASMDEPLNTCSIGFKEHFFDESADALLVAEHIKSRHHEEFVYPDILDVLDRVVWHFDEPFADASSIPTFYLCQMARKHVTVALAGDGGDEVFAGYSNYMRGMFVEKIKQRLPGSVKNLLQRPVNLLPDSMKGKTFLKSLMMTPQEGYFQRWCYFKSDMKKHLFNKDIAREIEDFDSLRMLKPYFNASKRMDNLSQWQFVDIKTYLVDDILTKVDKMSMAHSMEVRVPLLDHRLVEHALPMPDQFKIKNGISKYILKRCGADYLPKQTFSKAKHGFLLPIGEWFRSDLKEYTENSLFGANSVCKEYFNIDYIKKIWNIHQQKSNTTIDLSMHLWTLLMFEKWHSQFMNSSIGI